MNRKLASLFSASAFVAALALGGSIVASGTDMAFAGDKKADRLPVANAPQNVCEDDILGQLKDECVQKVVDGAAVQPVRTTTVEWRDEDNNTSTLVRAPVVDMANADEAKAEAKE